MPTPRDPTPDQRPRPLDLPRDLIVALNLSRDELTVLDSIAAHRWTFLDGESELLVSVYRAMGAALPDPMQAHDDRNLLGVCLHSPTARRLVARLDDVGVFVSDMTFDDGVGSLVCWLCGIVETEIVEEPAHLARLRGLLIDAATCSDMADDPMYWVWCSARNAIDAAEAEIRSYMVNALQSGKDLADTLDDLDTCRNAIDWLKGCPPSASGGAPCSTAKADHRAASCGVSPALRDRRPNADDERGTTPREPARPARAKGGTR